MPTDAKLALRPANTAEAKVARRDAPREQPERRAEAPVPRPDAPQKRPEQPTEVPSAPEKAAQPSRRLWVQWSLFLMLPLVLIVGGYWYVTGGQVMSTDNAYVE